VFILAVLVERWVSIKFALQVSKVKLSEGAYIEWDKLPKGGKGIQEAFQKVGEGLSQTPDKVTTLQQNLDGLIPGLAGLLLTFLCMWLLKKKVSPIAIIIGLFVFGVVMHVLGVM
jgi:Phosphotransferase system, mannose/fructose/N-acetylgalactosamine-specific component IID